MCVCVCVCVCTQTHALQWQLRLISCEEIHTCQENQANNRAKIATVPYNNNKFVDYKLTNSFMLVIMMLTIKWDEVKHASLIVAIDTYKSDD